MRIAGKLPEVSCAACPNFIRTQSEALDLLRNIVRVGHIRRTPRGGTVIEAKLDEEQVVRLCLFEAVCEDCEAAHDAERETWPEAMTP